MSRIRVIKEYDGRWTVWNPDNHKTTDIIKFNEYSLLPTNPKYRVDVNEQTIDSCIEHFQTAKSIAIKAVK